MKRLGCLLLCICFLGCDEDSKIKDTWFQLKTLRIGSQLLESNGSSNVNVFTNTPITLVFTTHIDINTARDAIFLYKGEQAIELDLAFTFENTTITASHPVLDYLSEYRLVILDNLRGENGEVFAGEEYTFVTRNGELQIINVMMDDKVLNTTEPLREVSLEFNLQITFSDALNKDVVLSDYIFLRKEIVKQDLTFNLNPDNKTVSISPSNKLSGLTHYYIEVSSDLQSDSGYEFSGFAKDFYTAVDPTPKFPIITDEELLTKVQEQTFKYFWDFGHPSSGLARERNTSGDVVTIGGSGFGVMSLIVGVERGFITRDQCLARLNTILNFLENCDRFHGAWPHWLNGSTGKIIPFSPTDDGGDLVETSFMVQGLITMRQYLDSNVSEENDLIQRINTLIDAVEYDWYTKGENILYWLWSPNNGYILKIQGYNETLITYFLAASSSTHSIPATAYTTGYSRSGAMLNGNSYYGYTLPLGNAYGGPLFFTHYSFLGLNPTNLSDQFANYWIQNVNQSLINRAYCADNPKNYVGYSDECWGLTASDNQNGYSAHSPTNDLGVITPTAALSSFPYTPEESMKALKFFYYTMGDRLWGVYGFYDAFNVTAGWTASSYLAIDQGPIIIMIENYRTGLLWNLFMSAPEVQTAMTKLGFTN